MTRAKYKTVAKWRRFAGIGDGNVIPCVLVRRTDGVAFPMGFFMTYVADWVCRYDVSS